MQLDLAKAAKLVADVYAAAGRSTPSQALPLGVPITAQAPPAAQGQQGGAAAADGASGAAGCSSSGLAGLTVAVADDAFIDEAHKTVREQAEVRPPAREWSAGVGVGAGGACLYAQAKRSGGVHAPQPRPRARAGPHMYAC